MCNELKEELKKFEVDENKTNSLLKTFNLTLDKLKDKYKITDNKYIKEGLNEINELTDYIKKLNIENKCKLTLSLARGQNYYTGTVFEVYDKDKIVTSSIGGGGRYDNMITNFIDDNEKYPAVGISFGLTAIYEILKEKKEVFIPNNSDIEVISVNQDDECLLLATKLRKLGYKVDIDTSNKKLKKKIEKADKDKIPYIIIIGEDEVKNEYFELKNIKTKETYKIEISNIDFFFFLAI